MHVAQGSAPLRFTWEQALHNRITQRYRIRATKVHFMDFKQASNMRKRIYQLAVPSQGGDQLSRIYDYFIIIVAVISLVPLAFKSGELPDILQSALNAFEIVTVYILTFDYVMRWVSADFSGKFHDWRDFVLYPLRLSAIIDLLGILPSLGIIPSQFMFLRIFRIVKVFAYSRHFRMMGRMLNRQRSALLSVLAVTCCYILFIALVVFSLEPDTFDGFFEACLWATTSLTSTSYGDIMPTTWVGKFVSQIGTIIGIAVIALPSGIIAGGYITELRASHESEDYFNFNDELLFDGKAITAYSSPRQYAQQNPQVVHYAKVMAICCVANFVLYELASYTALPVWLDTTGTAIAAFVLEPAAGIFVGFVNNLLLAAQSGGAGGILFLSESAAVAIIYGKLFKRGEKVSAKTVVKTLLLVVVICTLLQLCITNIYDDKISGSFAYLSDALQSTGTAKLLADALAIFLDRLVDSIAVMVIFLGTRFFYERHSTKQAE